MDGYTDRDFQRLRQSGVTLPNEPIRGRIAARRMGEQVRTGGSLQQDVSRVLGRSSRNRLDKYGSERMLEMGGSSPKERAEVEAVHKQRTASRREASNSAFNSSWQYAYPKHRDPFEYWRERTHWYDPTSEDDQDLERLRDWCRLLYSTHYLVPSLIDIYARFPLLDIEFQHKDQKLVDFYQSLFLDQLDYQQHLYDMGREHWTVGEVFTLGSWHDGIGAWEEEEIINPNDVVVAHSRILRSQKYRIKIPTEIKNLIQTQQPKAEYEALKRLYPDMVAWAQQDREIPVSDVLMKQIKFKTDPWSRHGTPILLRAFRQLMLEESLNAAQDAVADRFYSPLILARLGLDNVDDQGPWIPDPTELDALRNDLNVALMSDFRLMVYHHGLQIDNVFGRENMPRLDQDFDRIESKLMMVFGIGEELLRGGRSNAPYASGALNRELITQMLETYQVGVRSFMRERMEPIAERHGHYEYEKKGDRRIPIMEKVLVYDEETGEEYVQERPKLAIPEVRFKSMNLRDESVERQFLQSLKDQGFPVSDQALAVNIGIDFEDELERSQEETIEKIVAEQRMKAQLFKRLRAQDLPVPEDYQAEYQAWLSEQGYVDSTDAVEMPTGEGEQGPLGSPSDVGEGVGAPGGGGPPSPPPLAEEPELEGAEAAEPRSRPEISDEQRANMPRPAASKEASVVDQPFEHSVVDQPFNPAVYGDRMRFAAPTEMRKRRVMQLPEGMQITAPEDIDKFSQEKFAAIRDRTDADDWLERVRDDEENETEDEEVDTS